MEVEGNSGRQKDGERDEKRNGSETETKTEIESDRARQDAITSLQDVLGGET